MRQTGWYRVRHKLNDRWEFAEYYNEHWWITGQESPIGEENLEINEEPQNPEPIKRTDFAGFVNPKKTGLDGDGHPIAVK